MDLVTILTYITSYGNLGIPSYYGGGIMNQYAMQNKMDDITVNSLNASLFKDQPYEVEVAEQYNDIGLDWADKSSLDKTRVLEPNDGLIWDGDQDASGILWGGCVESLMAQVATDIYLPSSDDLEGAVLYLETAEDIPEHWVIEYLLTGFGERGWLKNMQGVLVGRPKTWEFNKQLTADQKAEYRKQQQVTVLKVVREYNPTCPVVQNIDFGHTDPQVVVPSGRLVEIKSKDKKLIFEY
jgi:muramoyltetrapeptide carboxypeptidase LdcA involved in peptidoglycan recycling